MNIKTRVKRAFFTILAAFATTFVAMIPLMLAGAGLVKGFAIATMIGISIGTFITRPTYGKAIETLLSED